MSAATFQLIGRRMIWLPLPQIDSRMTRFSGTLMVLFSPQTSILARVASSWTTIVFASWDSGFLADYGWSRQHMPTRVPMYIEMREGMPPITRLTRIAARHQRPGLTSA